MSLEPIDSTTATSTSAASRSVSAAPRRLTDDETALLGVLIDMLPNNTKLRAALPHARVEAMSDGGMGSLRFAHVGLHHMDHEAVAASSMDEDGVPISLALNLDENGDLYELDIWKVDFSPLVRLPKPEQIKRA